MLAVDAEALEQRLPLSRDRIRDQIRSLKHRAAELSDHVRRIAYQLHPSILEHLGLVVALRSHCSEFSQRQGVQTKFIHRGVPSRLPPDVALCLYRVAQEALRNVARHSGSTRTAVSLTRTGEGLHLAVTDFGSGFDSGKVRGEGGLGLISMGERVRLVHGTLVVKSQPGTGTRIDVRVPLLRESS